MKIDKTYLVILLIAFFLFTQKFFATGVCFLIWIVASIIDQKIPKKAKSNLKRVQPKLIASLPLLGLLIDVWLINL